MRNVTNTLKSLNKLNIRILNIVPVIGLFALMLTFSSVLNAQPLNDSQVLDRIIIKVNGEIVLQSEFDIALYQAKQNGYPVTGDGCDVLESLVINKMLVAQADIDSIVVDEGMIDAQLDRRMQYFIMQFGGEEAMEKAYGKSVSELKKELRPQLEEQLLIQRMQEEIMQNVEVTPAYVRQFFRRFPKDSLPYFPAEAEVGQIVKFPEVSKEQKQKVIDQLNEFRGRIMRGDNFKDLALLYSQDPGSADNGGELGFFGKGELVPEYEAAARSLQPGELSEPVESKFGFHLIQLIERRGAKFNTRHILLKPDASNSDGESAKLYLMDLKKKIEADSMSFEKAAREYSEDQLTAASGGLFSDPQTASTKLPLDQLESNVFFVIDTMDVGDISEPIAYTAQDGTKGYRLIYFKSKTKPHMANLSDDYIKISEAALTDKKSLELEKWFREAVNRMYIDVDQDYKTCKLVN